MTRKAGRAERSARPDVCSVETPGRSFAAFGADSCNAYTSGSRPSAVCLRRPGRIWLISSRELHSALRAGRFTPFRPCRGFPRPDRLNGYIVTRNGACCKGFLQNAPDKVTLHKIFPRPDKANAARSWDPVQSGYEKHGVSRRAAHSGKMTNYQGFETSLCMWKYRTMFGLYPKSQYRKGVFHRM